MSAFLGPVHHWMYGKIQLQETLTRRLLTLSTDPALAGRLEDIYGSLDTRPLEELIDQSNIHGWLNERVERAEGRYASAVEALMEQEGGALTPLTDATRALGREHAIPQNATPAAAYQAMDGVLLDGMPCDGGRQVVSEDGDELIFRYDLTLHPLCRRSEEGEVAFIALREALLGGMLENTKAVLDPLGGGSYRLRKEG